MGAKGIECAGYNQRTGMRARTLSQSGSVFLDCVRFGTAMVVFVGHIGRYFSAKADLDRMDAWLAVRGVVIHSGDFIAHLLHIAVCVFFVLSGFVIRMITQTRVTTMREFLIDRASRIYSVTAPALCLTLLLEAVSRATNPALYLALAEPFRWQQVPLQFVTNLTFTAQCWGYETNPLSNSPFWSLSFECIYYLLFALLLFGAKRASVRVAVALVMLLAGPSIVLLFPTWLLGCLLYDVYIRLDAKTYGVALATALLAAFLAAGFGARYWIGWLLNATEAPERSVWLAKVVPAAVQRTFADSNGVLPWLSRFSLSYYAAAIVVFVVMLWALLMLDRFVPHVPRRLAAALRWIAEGTFSLYLLHVPLLMLIACVVPAANAHRYLWCSAVVGVCILLSQPFSRLKLAMRRGLRHAFAAGAAPAR